MTVPGRVADYCRRHFRGVGAALDTTCERTRRPHVIGRVGAVAAVVPLLLVGCSDDEPTPTSTTEQQGPTTQLSQTRDLAELLELDSQFSRFLSLAEQHDLLDLLADEEITAFIPDTGAWAEAELPADGASDDEVVALLRRHLVPGRFTMSDLAELEDGTVTNLDGDELEVEVEIPRGSIGGARITKPDILAENGVIHVLGEVVGETDGDDGRPAEG